MRVANRQLEHVAQAMRGFVTDLDKSHFQAFKPFFGTNPITDEKGPSGAFSAKVPHIDMLLYGTQTPIETLDYLAKNSQYFPVADMAALAATQRQGVSLFDTVARSGAEAEELFLSMGNLMLAFRQFHSGAVNKHLGAAAVGSAEGDGAHAMLQRRRDNYATALHNANQRLTLRP